MPKRISKKTSEDANQTAYRVLQDTIAESETKSPDGGISTFLLSHVMSEMGRKGGKIGGKRSMETMTPTERKKRAKKAAKARWSKAKRG